MSDRRPARRPSSNRVVFYVIVGLAAVLILCGLVTQSIGWTRLCGGSLVVIGGAFFLLMPDKRRPILVILIGLALFFAESLLAWLTTGSG